MDADQRSQNMEEVEQIIRKYGLQEDREHVIIPLETPDGKKQRCFLLKRRFFRIAFQDDRFHDYPLEEVIEAIVTYPGMSLRESILLVHKEPEVNELMVAGGHDDEDDSGHEKKAPDNEIRGEGEEKNID
jgi:hypothetical protein